MRLSLALIPLILLASTAGAQEPSRALAVTVYANGLGLVKDRRPVTLEKGTNTFALEGVSSKARPETALLRPLCANPFTVRGQTFDFNVLSKSALLAHSLGREITLVRSDGPDRATTRAKVLSVANGLIVEMDGKIVVDPKGEMLFDELPPNLRPSPALLATVESPKAGACDTELVYLSNGLTWRADYTVELDPEGKSAQLAAWATVTNTSGADFPNATVQVVAGEVNARPGPAPRVMMEMAAEAAAPPMADAPSESLGSFYLYDLADKADLRDGQTRQLVLFSGRNLKSRIEYVNQGSDYLYRSRLEDIPSERAATILEIENGREDGAGSPLPAGTARVYKRDSKEALQFVGEDRLPNTPNGQPVRLRLGNDFDITVKRVQVSFQNLGKDRKERNVFETRHKITVANGKTKAASVVLRESMPGDWTISDESAPFTKASSGMAEWRLTVPAGGETEVTYTAMVRF